MKRNSEHDSGGAGIPPVSLSYTAFGELIDTRGRAMLLVQLGELAATTAISGEEPHRSGIHSRRTR
jgi:hypothetical protein